MAMDAFRASNDSDGLQYSGTVAGEKGDPRLEHPNPQGNPESVKVPDPIVDGPEPTPQKGSPYGPVADIPVNVRVEVQKRDPDDTRTKRTVSRLFVFGPLNDNIEEFLRLEGFVLQEADPDFDVE